MYCMYCNGLRFTVLVIGNLESVYECFYNIHRCVVVLFNSKKNKFHYLRNMSRLVCDFAM